MKTEGKGEGGEGGGGGKVYLRRICYADEMQESVRSRVAGSRPFSGGEICSWIEEAKKIDEAHTTKEGRDERKENVKYKRNSFSASGKHIKTRNIKRKRVKGKNKSNKIKQMNR